MSNSSGVAMFDAVEIYAALFLSVLVTRVSMPVPVVRGHHTYAPPSPRPSAAICHSLHCMFALATQPMLPQR